MEILILPFICLSIYVSASALWVHQCIHSLFNTLAHTSMHGQNVEFSHLIPGKFCFWREIFAILRGIADGVVGVVEIFPLVHFWRRFLK